MSATHKSRTFSLPIERPLQEVYDFLCVPENFPAWASGLCTSVKNQGGQYVAETARGPVKLRFTARNAFGVLDHYVSSGQGPDAYIPMRVYANGAGCEVSITIFRVGDTSEEFFIEDCRWVERDLNALKVLLEKNGKL